MFYSGLVVVCRPGSYETVKAAVAAMPGVEVHQCDPGNNRFVAVIESETVNGESDAFRDIRLTEGVLDVRLVIHREDA